jgi:type IV fimbrial biogenesis protein FimT
MLVSKGFTLVELLIVIVITSIMMTIAMPSFTDFMALTQVKTDASNLHLSLMRARSEAITRNTSITVQPAAGGWQDGWTISNGIETQGAAKTEIAGPASVIYNANGRVAGNAAVSFEISSQKTASKYCVTISLSGQPIVKSEACS